MSDFPVDQKVLARLRPIALALPEAMESVSVGHPSFVVRGKFFVLLSWNEGQPTIVVKVGKPALGVFLEDPRYFKSPYIGNHGWVGLRVGKQADWEEIGELVHGSYRLVAPKALVRQVPAIQ